MRKKLLFLFLAIVIMLSSFTTVSANNSYEMIYTDIAVCINHYNIPSFAVNGTSVVVVNDLGQYGITTEWLPYYNGFSLSVNTGAKITPVKYETDINQIGTVAGYAKMNATPVFIDGQQIPSYNLNGYTFIPVESLNLLGDVYWVPEHKVLKLWIEGLPSKYAFEPAPINEASKIYKETLEVVEAYRAVGEYETAVSALDWSIDALEENSSYYRALYALREEIAYIATVKNMNIRVSAGNYEYAAYDALYCLEYYCTYDSPYYNALVNKYAEYKYIAASKNIKIHLKNKDYYSAYSTALYAKNAIYDYAYDTSDEATTYYEILNDDVAAICKAWRGAIGSSLVKVSYWCNNGNLNITFINLSDKPIKAFKCKAELCDVFGENLYYGDHTLYVDNTWLSSYSSDTYVWSVNSKVDMLKYFTVTQVVHAY